MHNRISNKSAAIDSLFDSIPANYYARMESVLTALPAETRTLHLPKKRIVLVLAAAIAALLAIGTAAAVAVTLMQRTKDRIKDTVSEYQAVTQDAAPQSSGSEAEAVYVPLMIGDSDASGAWQPGFLELSDVSVSVGNDTLYLSELEMLSDQRFLAILRIESDDETSDAFTMDRLCLSVNGGEAIPATSDPVVDTPDPHSITWEVLFQMDKNPLYPNTMFTISGRLNGTDFSLCYTLSAESFEALRNGVQSTLADYTSLLSDMPGEAIPIHAYAYGYTVEEVAISGHWLYHVIRYSSENANDLAARKPLQNAVPYSQYDRSTFPVIDGIRSEYTFIGSTEIARENGFERLTLYRSYFPYTNELPKESLVSLCAAMFRIEWETGKVTLPKDDSEYTEWRRESAALSEKICQSDHLLHLHGEAQTFVLTDLAYRDQNGFGMIGIVLEAPKAIDNAHHGKDTQPVVSINGVVLENRSFGFTDPDTFVGGEIDGGKRFGFVFSGPAFCTLSEDMTVTVSWQGSETTVHLHRSDFVEERTDLAPYGALFGD